MRLLKWNDRDELGLTAYLYDREIPKYAALSHTWGNEDDEVSFTDLQYEPDRYRSKAGYEKLRFCSEQAMRDGIDYFWVDTCCIDKKNLSELSEAITSMYRWYTKAEKCYVYLSDVSAEQPNGVDNEQPVWMSELRSSRWFTRSWTLQELLAPSVVEFFSREGKCIGSRDTLVHELHEITTIPLGALSRVPLARYPPFERLKWGRGRQAKKKEDEAYSLMGICDVSMTIRYGEDTNALRRLEDKIRKQMGLDRIAFHDDDSDLLCSPRSGATSPWSRGFRSRRVIRGLPQRSSGTNIRELWDTKDAVNLSYAHGQLKSRDAGHDSDDADLSTGSIFNDMSDWDTFLHSLSFEQSHDRMRRIGVNTPGTCDWLLESPEYMSWMQDNGLLLVRGHPGSGKSILIKYALTKQSSYDSDTLAFSFFFHKGGIDLQSSAQGMFRSLLRQLLDEDEDSRPAFYELCHSIFGAHVPSRSFKWNQQDLRDIFGELVHGCAARRTVRIFIDAVDECRDQDREDVIQFFHSLRGPYQGAVARIATFMTTRNHLRGQVEIDFEIPLEDRNQHDISQYIEKELRFNDSTGLARDALKSLLQDQAKGSFLWLKLVLRRVRELIRKGENLSTIEQDVQRCPMELDELYEGLLKEIPQVQMAEAGSLFQWICFAARPLSAAELRTAWMIHATGKMTSMKSYADKTSRSYIADDEQLWNKVSHLGKGLVDFSRTASADVETTVQFYHETVRDFMLNKGLQIIGREIGDASRLIEVGDARLANACLWFLSCHEVVTAMLERDLGFLTQHAFFQYAGDYWFSHATKAEQTGKENDVDWPSSTTLAAWIHLGQKVDSKMSSHFAAGFQPLHVAAQHGLTGLVQELVENIDERSGPKTNIGPGKRLRAPTFSPSFASSTQASVRKAEASTTKQNPPKRTPHERPERSNTRPAPRSASGSTDRRTDETGLKGESQPSEVRTPSRAAKNQESLNGRKRRTNMINVQDINGNTPLFLAASRGHLNMVILLHKEGADVRLQAEDNSTPLYMASRNDHLPVIKFLFEHGAAADIHAPTKDNWTPICAASYYGHLEVVKFLYNNGASTDIHKTAGNGQTPLYVASRGGHLGVVEFLVKHGAVIDVLTRTEDGRTPLYTASNYGHLDVIKLLLKHKAGTDINTSTQDGWTPLYVASLHGHLNVIEILLEHGSDIHASTQDGWTPLGAAVCNGHLEVVRVLLEHGATIADVYTTTQDEWTPVCAASHHGHLDVIKLLLEHSATTAHIHTSTQDGWTPLYAALCGGHLEVVKLLLEHGASVHTRTQGGWTPICTASHHGDLDIVKCLIEHGADVNAFMQDGWTPLYLASRKGHLEVVKFLLEHGANAHTCTQGGWTPICAASHHGDLDIVKCLIEYGADVNASMRDGWTPLYAASHKGHLELVRCLLEHSVNIHASTQNGWTSLHVASSKGHLEIVRCLLEDGADIHASTQSGWTPLCAASSNGHLETVKFLLEHGANIHALTKDRQTLLHMACRWNHLEIVQLLFKAGVNVNACDSYGQSPLVYATRRGCKEICQFLTRSSADVTLVDRLGRTAADWLKLLETDDELLKSICSDPDSPPNFSAECLDASIVSVSTEIINEQTIGCDELFNGLGRYFLVCGDVANANIAFQQNIETTIPGATIQHERPCGLCSVYPIEGSRFICKVCLEADLCPPCMDKYRKGEHFAACRTHEYFEVSERASAPMDRDSLLAWLQDIVKQYTHRLTA